MMLYKRRRERKRGKKKKEKKVTEIIKKNDMYKIDNIYQKAKIKNLEFGLSKIQY